MSNDSRQTDKLILETVIETKSYVAALTQEVHDFKRAVIGNGTPGRLTKLETTVSSLQRHRWLMTGGGLAIVILAELIYHVVNSVKH